MHGRLGALAVIRPAVVASVLASLMLASGTSYGDEPLAPEADTNPNVRPAPPAQVNLVLVGVAVTAGWYGIALGTSYLWSDSDGAAPLRIPVAGPYMALAKTGCGAAEGPDCDTLGLVVRTVITALSAVGQTGGVLAMGEGLFLSTSNASARRRRERAASDSWSRASLMPKITVSPVAVGKSGLGLSLSGNF
jgi:hypothetical protein